jgi:hypothetical protein
VVVAVASKSREGGGAEGGREDDDEPSQPDGQADDHCPPEGEHAFVQLGVDHVQVAVQRHAGQKRDGHLKKDAKRQDTNRVLF